MTSALYLLRWLHYRGLLKQTEGYYGKLKTMFTGHNDFTLLVLGSSRAEMHYDTPLLDSLTGQRSFNLGLSGAMPDMAFIALKTYLANSQPPKYLLFEADFHILKYRQPDINNFNNYFPFFSNKTLRQGFNAIDGRMSQFHYNPYYSLPYSGLKNLSTSLHGWLNIPNPNDKRYVQGFFYEDYNYHLDYLPSRPVPTYLHPYYRAYMDSIIGLCKANNIQLTLVTSPIFAGGAVDIANPAQMGREVNNIARINKIPYYNLSAVAWCADRRHFLDHQHLKYSGARLFTLQLARSLTIK